MDWKYAEFTQLSTPELYAILSVRSAVFVVEYAHIHLDIDHRDPGALHVVALESAQDTPQVAAYARLQPGDEQDPEITIDRLLTASHRRDDDTRDHLVAHALVAARTRWPEQPIYLNVPADQATLYERFGFKKAVGPFLDYGMSFLTMAWRPTPAGRRRRAIAGGSSQQRAISAAGELPEQVAVILGALT